jgi:hypothetical protein
MFAEPLSGFRQATASQRRTRKDCAIEVAQLLDTRYADCERVTLVLDNLNTHTKGAFYVVLAPDGACLLEYGSNSVTRRSTAVG